MMTQPDLRNVEKKVEARAAADVIKKAPDAAEGVLLKSSRQLPPFPSLRSSRLWSSKKPESNSNHGTNTAEPRVRSSGDW